MKPCWLYNTRRPHRSLELLHRKKSTERPRENFAPPPEEGQRGLRPSLKRWVHQQGLVSQSDNFKSGLDPSDRLPGRQTTSRSRIF